MSIKPLMSINPFDPGNGKRKGLLGDFPSEVQSPWKRNGLDPSGYGSLLTNVIQAQTNPFKSQPNFNLNHPNFRQTNYNDAVRENIQELTRPFGQSQYFGNSFQNYYGLTFPLNRSFGNPPQPPPLPPEITKPPLPKEPHPSALQPLPFVPSVCQQNPENCSSTTICKTQLPKEPQTLRLSPPYPQHRRNPEISSNKTISKTPKLTTIKQFTKFVEKKTKINRTEKYRHLEFKNYKNAHFTKLKEHRRNEGKDKGKMMTSMTQRLVDFIAKRELNSENIEDICKDLAEDPLLEDPDISRIIIWTLVSITNDFFSNIIHPKTGRFSSTHLKTLEAMQKSVETAFSTALPKFDFKNDIFLLEEVISMMNNYKITKPEWANEATTKIRQECGTKFYWPKNYYKVCESFSYYFENVMKRRKAVLKTKNGTALSGLMQKWESNQLRNRREKALKEVLQAGALLRKLYNGKYGQKEMDEILLYREDARFNGERRAGFYIPLLWTAVVALQEGGNHTQMCALVHKVMTKVERISPNATLRAGIKPRELWNIFYNLRKTCSGNCYCRDVATLIDSVFPREKLKGDEASKIAKECGFFFQTTEKKMSMPVQKPIKPVIVPKPCKKKEEIKQLPPVDVQICSSSAVEEKSYQNTVEKSGLKKPGKLNEKVFIMPQFKPLSLEEILNGMETRNSGSWDQSEDEEENNPSQKHIIIENRNNNNKGAELKADRTWPQFSGQQKKVGESSSRRLNKSSQDEDPKGIKGFPNTDKSEESFRNFTMDCEIICLQNPFCRKLYMDLITISRKQGIKVNENGVQLVFFLDKCEETEQLRNLIEDLDLCQCCNYKESLEKNIETILF